MVLTHDVVEELMQPGIVLFTERFARPPWMADALCLEHPEIDWIPADERRRPDDVAGARAVCSRCVTRAECLAYALADPALVGLWAGTTTAQRKAIRRSSVA